MMMAHNKKKIRLLDEVPCGDQFKACKFIKDAYEALDWIKENETKIIQNKKELSQLLEEIEQLNPIEVDKFIKSHEDFSKKRIEIEKKIRNIESERNDNKITILENKQKVKVLKEKYDENLKNKELFDNIGKIKINVENKKKELLNIKNSIESENMEIQQLYRTLGSEEHQLESLEQEQTKYSLLKSNYELYNLILKCFHFNGIISDILKKNLPVINGEIQRILENIVDFNVFLEIEEGNLDIYIQHPGKNKRLIETGSGAEKTLAALAIRLALIKVSSLPTSNIFILDEPATALDVELQESFVDMLQILKNEFDSVIIISHMESLKDCADIIINIEKDENGRISIQI